MAGTLQSRLGALALQFSESVLEAIRGASLEELFGESAARGASAVPRAQRAPRTAHTAPVSIAARPAGPGRKPRPGRLSRRSASDIERVISEIVSLLGESPVGMRAEQIRQRLGLVAKELPRPLKEALDSGRIGKSGQKRATTYFVAGAARAVGAGVKAPARAARKASAKRKAAAGQTRTPKAKKSVAAKRGGAKRGARRPARSAKARKASKSAK
jgi:hypothetical protein